MTMLDPSEIDWSEEPDSTVYFAAVDGVPEAVKEQQRREAQRRTTPNSQE